MNVEGTGESNEVYECRTILGERIEEQHSDTGSLTQYLINTF